MNAGTEKELSDVVRESESGTRHVGRRIFSCPDLYEREFKQIWGKVWVYVAHESQLKKPRDFITTWIGRVPVIINRNKAGELNALVNICTHRGATLCRVSKGSATVFSCSFHGWTFSLDGELKAPMAESEGAYPAGFDKSRLGLRRLRLENYRGFLFATLNERAGPLSDYLAESRAFIDLIVDQSPNGVEVLKGSSSYTYNGNWKLQAENGVDGYHVASVHANYITTVMQRMKSTSVGDKTQTLDASKITSAAGGYYDLGKGHTLIWSELANPESRPLWSVRDELSQRMGTVKSEWALRRARNLLLYPNLLLMDQMSSQIRVFRPLAVNKTEVTIYCFAPVGEALADRARRIRQYEDFFNASGMATPDDLTEFNECQLGAEHHDVIRWSELSRGAEHEVAGANALANELGVAPGSSGARFEDEGIFIAQHERWAELMSANPEEAS